MRMRWLRQEPRHDGSKNDFRLFLLNYDLFNHPPNEVFSLPATIVCHLLYGNPADYIVNALLVQKIEKEKGFSGVWELLTVGPFEKGNAAYYQTLEKLTGITQESYNAKVWELVRAEK